MATIVVTAAKVGLVNPAKATVKSYIAHEALTAGLPVYIVAGTGKVGIADADDANMLQFRGITLGGAGAGQAVDVLEEGEMYGFTHTTNYDTRLYVTDVAGVIGDTAGSASMVVGRVAPMANKSITKVLHVTVDRITEVA